VAASNASGSGTQSASDDGYRALSPPANVAASDGTSTTSVTITWDAASGATSYKIYRDTDSDPAGASDLGSQSSGYVDSTVAPGQGYWYWVTALSSSSSSESATGTGDTGYARLATIAA
jgi:fibronectin type 3 domain-containing protein